jgi:hypothetical protein
MMSLPAENIREVAGPVSYPPALSETAAVLSMIERAARDPAVDIDKLERLMKLQEDRDAARSRVAFDAAMAEMQPKLPTIDRRGRIEVREKTSSGRRDGDIQQSTPYALWEDINEAIRPILATHGFSLTFRAGRTPEGLVTVTGILAHRDGHREEDTFVLQHDSTGSKNAVQAVGSSNSYGKRYTAINLLNITTRGQDDDGKAAGAPEAITQDQADDLQAMIESVGANKVRFLKHFEIEQISQLPARQYQTAINMLNAKARG